MNSIKIADNLSVCTKFSKKDFMKTSFYNNRDLSVFFWIRKKFKVKNHDFYIGFLFGDEKISQLQLYCIDESFENEEKRKAFNDEFAKEITDDFGCAWGNIKSVENKRENIALIIINYD